MLPYQLCAKYCEERTLLQLRKHVSTQSRNVTINEIEFVPIGDPIIDERSISTLPFIGNGNVLRTSPYRIKITWDGLIEGFATVHIRIGQYVLNTTARIFEILIDPLLFARENVSEYDYTITINGVNSKTGVIRIPPLIINIHSSFLRHECTSRGVRQFPFIGYQYVENNLSKFSPIIIQSTEPLNPEYLRTNVLSAAPMPRVGVFVINQNSLIIPRWSIGNANGESYIQTKIVQDLQPNQLAVNLSSNLPVSGFVSTLILYVNVLGVTRPICFAPRQNIHATWCSNGRTILVDAPTTESSTTSTTTW